MSPPDSDPNRGASGKRSKVARLIDAYGLDGLGDELEAAWLDESDDRMSLRELAEYFNKQLIEAELKRAGQDPLPGEVETVYGALRAEDMSSGLEREVRGRLDRYGIDVGDLEGDLVSYQAIRSYLTEYRGAEYEGRGGDPIESAQSGIQRLSGRLRAVSDQRLDELRNGGHLSLGEYRVLVQVQVYCEDCGRQYDIDSLLESGGCDCESAED